MKTKQIIKRILDLMMVVILPVLMAEILTGQETHEWLGTGMIVCFLLHHILNFSWGKNLFKGVYHPVRALMAVINLLLLADMLVLAVSGIMMSGFVFNWLPITGGMIAARQLHLFASYWGFILMSAHLGCHIGMLLKGCRKMFHIVEDSPVRTWVLRTLVFSASIYGLYALISQKVASYLFLQTHFVLFDETKPAMVFFLETAAMIVLFAMIFHNLQKFLAKIKCDDVVRKIAKPIAFLLPIMICVTIAVFMNIGNLMPSWTPSVPNTPSVEQIGKLTDSGVQAEDLLETTDVSDGFIKITGGTFLMGSPDREAWRVDDETQHTVTVSDFYISPYEVTQKEYQNITGHNPSNFIGENLPVENVTWLEAVAYCNARSEKEGLTPAYTLEEESVAWNREANGYRLPTEAEWEYACRAGTQTPFNMEDSPSAEVCNFYGHYPYQIEENYFSQENLETKPGEYRQTTVAVDSFSPNKWGLYNMHGNVSEWVWDWYGTYDLEAQTDPTGAQIGVTRVYRGGGWNDFAKNMRSAYRATLAQNKGSFNLGIRLVRNAITGSGTISGETGQQHIEGGGKMLISFFSWGGNTKGIAEEIQAQTGADLFEIELVHPYSDNYNTVLEQAQHDQNIQARPEIANQIDRFDQYDIIFIGYPNWWASIPMPIASLLEEYDFSGKTIIPFCSHGGGRFGQSLTAIAKLSPHAIMGEPLSIHYSGGSSLASDIETWLKKNNIQ